MLLKVVIIPQGISLASRLLVYKVEVQKEIAVYYFNINGTQSMKHEENN